jgi:hypothetical protein
MSVANNAWGNGVEIVQRECTAGNDAGQIFTLVPFEGGKFFEILVNAHSTPQLGACVDVAGGSTTNGALLHQWDCSNGSGANQLWQPAQINGESWYALMAKHSGKCADVEVASTAMLLYLAAPASATAFPKTTMLCRHPPCESSFPAISPET